MTRGKLGKLGVVIPAGDSAAGDPAALIHGMV